MYFKEFPKIDDKKLILYFGKDVYKLYAAQESGMSFRSKSVAEPYERNSPGESVLFHIRKFFTRAVLDWIASEGG